jgi:hypothetical protein
MCLNSRFQACSSLAAVDRASSSASVVDLVTDQGEEEPSHHYVAPRMSLPHEPSQEQGRLREALYTSPLAAENVGNASLRLEAVILRLHPGDLLS